MLPSGKKSQLLYFVDLKYIALTFHLWLHMSSEDLHGLNQCACVNIKDSISEQVKFAQETNTFKKK